MEEYTFTAEVWRWPAQNAWRFVALPPDVADTIEATSGPPKGFGSLRVEVTIGGTTWRTSVFPDSTRGTYVLPVKKAVRDAERIADGDDVAVSLRVIS